MPSQLTGFSVFYYHVSEMEQKYEVLFILWKSSIITTKIISYTVQMCTYFVHY